MSLYSFVLLEIFVTTVRCLEIQPFGIKMCQRLCQKYPTCSKFDFQETELLCRLKTSTRACESFTLPKSELPHRNEKYVCITSSHRSSEHQVNLSSELLLVQHKEYLNVQIRQMQKTSTSLHFDLMDRISGWVTAMTYVSKTKQIVLGFHRKRIIEFYNVRGFLLHSMSGMTATDFQQDVFRDLVIFVSLRMSGRCLIKMTTSGQNLMQIYCLKKNLFLCRIAVDSRQKLIFFTERYRLRAVYYNGNPKHFDKWRNIVVAVAVDPNVLYFTDGQTIYRTSANQLNSKRERIWHSLRNNISQLIVIKYSLYILLRNQGSKMFVIDLRGSSRKTSRIIKTGYRENFDISLCEYDSNSQ